MAQNDFGTINPNTKSGTELASDLNGFRDAVNSNHMGSARPAYAVAGLTWVDNTSNPWIYYLYDGGDDIKIGEFDTTTNVFTPESAVTGPASSTDNALVRFDGTTGKAVQNSGVTVDDGGNMTLPADLIEPAYIDVASDTTTDIGAAAGRYVQITGTTTITGLGTAAAGVVRHVRFAAALTLTHNATSLILPGGANITTAADDTATFVSLGAGNWLCSDYKKQSGEAVVAAGGGAWTLIESKVPTASASLDFTTGIDSTYDTYVFVFSNIAFTSDGPISLRVSTDGGSTFLSSLTDYTFIRESISQSATVSASGEADEDRINLQRNSVTSNGMSYVLYVSNPASTSFRTSFHGAGASLSNSGVYHEKCAGGTLFTTAVNAIRFFTVNGSNFTAAGSVSLYGISN